MGSRLTRVSGVKHRRFLFGSILTLGVLAIAWYACFAMNGIFQRNVDSVVNTEWISWDNGTLSFGEYQARLVTDSTTFTYNFEEREGTIWMKSQFENDQLVLVRFKNTRMITSDGKRIFYLKSAESAGGESDE